MLGSTVLAAVVAGLVSLVSTAVDSDRKGEALKLKAYEHYSAREHQAVEWTMRAETIEDRSRALAALSVLRPPDDPKDASHWRELIRGLSSALAIEVEEKGYGGPDARYALLALDAAQEALQDKSADAGHEDSFEALTTKLRQLADASVPMEDAGPPPEDSSVIEEIGDAGKGVPAPSASQSVVKQSPSAVPADPPGCDRGKAERNINWLLDNNESGWRDRACRKKMGIIGAARALWWPRDKKAFEAVSACKDHSVRYVCSKFDWPCCT